MGKLSKTEVKNLKPQIIDSIVLNLLGTENQDISREDVEQVFEDNISEYYPQTDQECVVLFMLGIIKELYNFEIKLPAVSENGE